MLILVLLGMYFDAVVVFVTNQTLLFRLALAILCFMYLLTCENGCNGRNDNRHDNRGSGDVASGKSHH